MLRTAVFPAVTGSLVNLCRYDLILWPYLRPHTMVSIFPPAFSVSVSVSFSVCLSWARFLSGSLAACLAGCQLLIYIGNILAVMAAYGLCQTEYNKQEIRFQMGLLADGKRKRNDSNHYCITATIKTVKLILCKVNISWIRMFWLMKMERKDKPMSVRRRNYFKLVGWDGTGFLFTEFRF